MSFATVTGTLADAAFDPVQCPAHYVDREIEVIDFIKDCLDIAFVNYCQGNAIKYLSRAEVKGSAAQDFAKAAWYCQMAAHAVDPERYADPRAA